MYFQIPNGLGVAFAVAQLVLHVVYHKSTVRQLEERKKKVETGLVKPNGSSFELEDQLEKGTKGDNNNNITIKGGN